jgi:hypothetical protein
MLSEIWIQDTWDLGSDPGLRKLIPDPDPGVKKGTGSRIPIPALTFVFSAFCLDFKWTIICWVFSANPLLPTPPYSFSILPGIPYSQLFYKQKCSNQIVS